MPVDFALDEVADEVVAWREASFRDERHEIRPELFQRPHPGLGVVEHVDQVKGPTLEVGHILFG